MFDTTSVIIVLLSFGAVAALVYVLGRSLATQIQIQRRLPVAVRAGDFRGGPQTSRLQAFVARHFDERRFGVDSTLRGKLRRDLVRAGFFRADALNYYIFARIALVIVLPFLTYAFTQAFLQDVPLLLRFVVLLIALVIAILGPDAYLSRRQRAMSERYRQVFPDFLDLLTVCVDAGLSLEAAMDRVTGHLSKQSREFGLNLMMVGAETRAGRTMVEALESMADRLGIDEAQSLVLVLRQSLELGSDVGEALHVFSDEMRAKRLLRAEELANKLPVKMTFPLGLFIFPVILLVVLLPVGIRLVSLIFR
ncbi:MAG TPA: type II secretion system F family protein [Xanthobacteraceae bacterium]|nr:type II secretion system F family protein [Xanthobacteraceae bacterium]